MASLSPASGNLITTQEDVFVSATITASGFVIITGWEWEFIPIGHANTDVVPHNFTFDETAYTLTVNYHDNRGLFPVQYIQYIDPGVNLHTIYDQDDLPPPPQAPELVTVFTDGRNFQTWHLVVSVSGMSEEGPITITETYEVIVEANYNGIRDWIKEKVEERSPT